MLFISVCAAICAGIAVRLIHDCEITFTILGVSIGILMWITIGSGIGWNHLEPYDVKLDETAICALNDTSQTNESFFLFAGSVGDELVYRYVSNSQNGKRVGEVCSDNVYIKEGDYEPRVEKHCFKYANKAWWLFSIPPQLFPDNITYIFYVPPNTVTTEYCVDLE